MFEGEVKVVRRANNKKTGMTLEEVRAFCDHAQFLGLSIESRVKVTTGYRQQIIKLEIS